MLIYALENKHNGKVYIGQTRRTFKKRLRHHEWKLRCGTHTENLQKDFDEYGFDGFEFYVLEDNIKTLDKLNDRETQWIKKLETFKEDKGYNIAHTGYVNHYSDDSKRKQEGLFKIPVVKYSLKGEKLAEYESMTEASNDVDITLHSLIVCLQGKTKTCAGYQWRYLDEKKDKISPHVKRKLKGEHNPFYGKESGNRQEVYQYDLDGNFIKRYDCIKQAAEDTGLFRSSISRAASGRYKSSGGFKWSHQALN